jgi:hypothetical protein
LKEISKLLENLGSKLIEATSARPKTFDHRQSEMVLRSFVERQNVEIEISERQNVEIKISE